MSIHFVNLSNGTACIPHIQANGFDPHFMRIQSTSCEQKRWGDVVLGAGPDFMYRLAQGENITVHDCSERHRITRACWQGITVIRYFAGKAWGVDAGKPIMRGRHDATGYLDAQWRVLSESHRRWLKYWRKYLTRNYVPEVNVCRLWAWPRIEVAA